MVHVNLTYLVSFCVDRFELNIQMEQVDDMVRMLSRDQAKDFLLGQLLLKRNALPAGKEGVRQLLRHLRCIQLDPLDPMGTNQDLVALARVDRIRLGDVFRHHYPGLAFEHFAKERCLLPAPAFPYYRSHAVETPWWRQKERMKRVTPQLLQAVLEEVRRHGPMTPDALTDRGRVEPLDYSGWKSTAKAASFALEVLWLNCSVVVAERQGRTKSYDVPERVFADLPDVPAESFGRWALLDRVEAAGLLSRSGGPQWSMLGDVRNSDLPGRLIREGALEEVSVAGSSRKFLAPADFLKRTYPDFDRRLRILGPLDPLLWDRKLVKHLFDFDYVWEVYKPVEKRIWGWYVHPLLYQGRFVGRIEGRLREGVLEIDRVWPEEGRFPWGPLEEALGRHAAACGAGGFRIHNRGKN